MTSASRLVQKIKAKDCTYSGSRPKAGGHLRVNSLAMQTGADTATVQREIESYLIIKGLVSLDRRGRFLTPSGRELAERGRL